MDRWMTSDVILNITDRNIGQIFWDGVLQIAVLSFDQRSGMHTLRFLDDPLGWGDQDVLSEAAAKYLALAYANELRAVKAKRQ